MATDNHQDQDRIDRLEAAFIDLAETQRRQEETQRQQLAAIQRHDMLLEMAQAIQRDHEQTLQMLTSNQERYEATQNQIVGLMDTVVATLNRVIDTQQEQSAAIAAIRVLLENRYGTP